MLQNEAQLQIIDIFIKVSLQNPKITSFLGSCDIKNIRFLGDLPNKISLMSGPSGYSSRDQYSFKVPCGDRAYFINAEKVKEEINKKKIDPNYESPIYNAIKDEPLILDAVGSTEDNFFIMSGSSLAASSNVGKIKVDYLYSIKTFVLKA